MESLTLAKGVIATGGTLEKILGAKVARLAAAKRLRPLELVIEDARRKTKSRQPVSLAGALSRSGRTNIIAEIKRRSPSKGVIREDFDPVMLAEAYERAGAAAISILCEEDYFNGSLDHLRAARHAARVPLLRKDFIFDPYQLHESVEAESDAVLLITAILEDELLAELVGLAGDLGLDAIVEVHTPEEMRRAARAKATIIGVNNRNLATFDVDLATSIDLARLAPAGAILVSESGITNGEDIHRLKKAGFNAFLIGESLMRAADPGAALSRLIEESER